MTHEHVNMYGVSRIDDDKHFTHAWRVSLRRRGKLLVKNFPDKKYEGRRNALNAALAYRDGLLAEHPPITRKEFAEVRRRNNTSGVTGVYRYAKPYKLADGRQKEIWYWEAHWPTESGHHQKVSFAVNRYGEDLARQLAIRARMSGLRQVQGVYWASERGASPNQCGLDHASVIESNADQSKSNSAISSRY